MCSLGSFIRDVGKTREGTETAPGSAHSENSTRELHDEWLEKGPRSRPPPHRVSFQVLLLLDQNMKSALGLSHFAPLSAVSPTLSTCSQPSSHPEGSRSPRGPAWLPQPSTAWASLSPCFTNVPYRQMCVDRQCPCP